MESFSIIIPSYNVGQKLSSCFASLDEAHEAIGGEVIFVDDRSSDGTFESIVEFASSRPWVKALRLDVNSGSPSAPRNVGVDHATTKYVVFLDSDDQILSDGLASALEIAERTNADLVRAPLIRSDEKGRVLMNEIDDWSQYKSRKDKAWAIVRYHSTTPTAVYSREFLARNNIQWRTDLHMAEDAVFLYESLAVGKVEFSREPIYVYDARVVEGATSATQRYGDAEMQNHIKAWGAAQEILGRVGIDFFRTRGQIALQAVFENTIKYNRSGFSEDIFTEFSQLLNQHRDSVSLYSYGPRFAELRDLVLDCDFVGYREAIKPRLLIAGYDLKFIQPSFEVISRYYQIMVDEWTSHEGHDEERSQALLQWADIIFCEWMLGNAVWYSKRKLARQSLVIRLHRFEITRNFGFQVQKENVDVVIGIAPAMIDQIQMRFGFPREKLRYMPNYLAAEKYRRGATDMRVHTLAMVGVLPKLKGLYRALELLHALVQVDEDFKLFLYGKRPEELPWIAADESEMAYYQECREYVQQHGLEKHIRFKGWVDTEVELANVGFVLSMSDLEGSHVAAAEGFASGGITVFRPWAGVDMQYPGKYVFDSVDEMAQFILRCRDSKVYETERLEGLALVSDMYGEKNFETDLLRNLPAPKRVP